MVISYVKDLEIGFEHREATETTDAVISPFVQYYLFMPRGTALLLGRVLLMYWHKMTRMVRDLLYIQATDIQEVVYIEGKALNEDQLEIRKYLF